jgi:hypothetical protein
MNIKDYSFEEHRHRYAVWTAARAVQRSFTTTENISKAINATSLRSFAESNEPVSQHQFDELHKQWCDSIMSYLEAKDCSYGRAAKIAAIYLKTAVVLPACGIDDKSLVIHPPIDRILLQTIGEKEGLKELLKKKWTQLGKDDYWNLVSQLRNKFNLFNWTLEAYWKPENERIAIK